MDLDLIDQQAMLLRYWLMILEQVWIMDWQLELYF